MSTISLIFEQMMNSITERDLRRNWDLLTQMKDMLPPPAIASGDGATLITEDGSRIIDGISSWWVNIHGHGHPAIAETLN